MTSRRRTHQPDCELGTSPEGVRLRLHDGTGVACDVIRDPEDDADGYARWAAVPRTPVTAQDVAALEADMIPPRTELSVSLDRGPAPG